MLYYSHPVVVRYKCLFDDEHLGLCYHETMILHNGDVISIDRYLEIMKKLGIEEDDAITELEWLDLDTHL